MKIEKINENQIRCTLTKEDLADRQMRISELAYGSEKARLLFRDMIEQANYEFGFEVNDIPLMVEAIPTGSDNITLVITKVEYPEELDTRFSKFSEPNEALLDQDEEEPEQPAFLPKGADDILGLFQSMKEAQESKKTEENPEKAEEENTSSKAEPVAKVAIDLTKYFEFGKFEQVETLAHILNGFYEGENDLYHNLQKNRYVLFLHKSSHSPEEFNKVCNMASEYAVQRTYSNATLSYYREHGKLIVKGNALQTLAQI